MCACVCVYVSFADVYMYNVWERDDCNTIYSVCMPTYIYIVYSKYIDEGGGGADPDM